MGCCAFLSKGAAFGSAGWRFALAAGAADEIGLVGLLLRLEGWR